MNKVKQLSPSLALLGRLTQLDITYFLSGGLFSSIQQVIGILCGLAISYLFGHYVSKDVFGQYNLILSIISLFTFVSFPGIDIALTRSIGQGFDESFRESQRIKLRFSLLGVPLLLALAAIYWIQKSYNVSISLLITSAVYPFLYSFTNYQTFLFAKKKFSFNAILGSLSSLFFLFITYLGIKFIPETVGLVVCFLIATIIPSLYASYYSRKFIREGTISDPDLKNYGSFLTAISILPWISGNIGNIILGTVIGTQKLAIFAVASRFYVTFMKNFIVFYKPASVKIAYQNKIEHVNTIKTHWLKFILLGIVSAFLLWLTSPILIRFFFTEKYEEAILYAQILSFAVVPIPISWLLSDMIIYQKKKKVQVITSIVPHVIKILLYFVLIPTWGITGLVGIILLERFSEPLIPLYSLLKEKGNKL